MTFYAYSIIPIDWSWEFQPTIKQIAAKFAEHDATLAVVSDQFEQPLLPTFMKKFEIAKDIARANGWEGDYRPYATPKVFFIPGEGHFEYGFAWKQDNNGTTFVLSPIPLPHLSELG